MNLGEAIMEKEIIKIECENPICKNRLWSDKPGDIKQWRDLQAQGALYCPICGAKMKFVRARGEINTGGQ